MLYTKFLKRIIVYVIMISLIFPGQIFGNDEVKFVKPLSIGRQVKIYLNTGEEVVGILESWDRNEVVLETKIGVLKVDVVNVKKAVYLVGDSGLEKREIKIQKKVIENETDFELKKNEWDKRLKNAEAERFLLCTLGVSLGVLGFITYLKGEEQRQNADFVIKGDYVTNEDDVNEGNRKVVIGWLEISFGVMFLVLGIAKKHKIRTLKEEGKYRGFIAILDKDKGGDKFKVAYKLNF